MRLPDPSPLPFQVLNTALFEEKYRVHRIYLLDELEYFRYEPSEKEKALLKCDRMEENLNRRDGV